MDNSARMNIYTFKPYRFQLVQPSQECEQPEPRSGHRIVCSAKYLYVYGGYNPSFEPSLTVQDMWKFNFATRKWEQYADSLVLPVEVSSAAAVRRRQQLLIYGGTGVPFGYRCSNQLYTIKLNEERGAVSPVEIAGRAPRPMYGQAMVIHKSILYTVGGTTGFTYTCDVHRVNLRKTRKVWKKLYLSEEIKTEENGKYIPEGRYRHELGFDGKNIYVLGGGTCDESFSLANIPTFNIESKMWQELKTKGDPNSASPFPAARKYHGVVYLKSKNDTYVFVMGGCEDCELVYNDLWMLELSTLQWTLLQSCALPRGLFFHSTGVTREGKMYAFGGIKQGFELTRTNELYSAWMCIPKLLEMCWEAILQYCGHVNLTKEMLRGLKVPDRLIDRLE